MLNYKKIILIIAFITTLNPCCNTFAATVANNATFYYNTGVDFQNKGKNDLAIKNYKKALSLNPKLSNARNNMLYAYLSLATEFYKNKQHTQAIQNFKNALTINPKMAEVHYNLGLAYHNTGQPDLAIKSYEKALSLNPDFTSAKNNLSATCFNLGIKSCNDSKYSQAIQYYKKSLKYNPADADVYYNIGVTYNLMGLNEEALPFYKKAIELNPDFSNAYNNLKISQEKLEEKELANKINNLLPSQKAPFEVYTLVKPEKGINNTAVNELYQILDFIWGDPDGQKLLLIIKNNKIPIVITSGSENTNAQISISNSQKVITYAGIPIFSFDNKQNKNITINIGEKHVLGFKNPDLPLQTRIYSLHTVVHELCHAVKNSTAKMGDNAINEEITASMIGYNIASRITRGRNLTEKEADNYAKRCMQAVLQDDHRYLPVYNNFPGEIQKLGINPPYMYLYQNVVQLYRSVRNDPQTQKIDTLERMITSY